MSRVVACGAACAVLLCSNGAVAGTTTKETHGGREWRVHVPDGAAASRPLVVMLHGCTQTADGFADATRMDDVADEKGFVVAYPEQTAEMGLNACFVWWEPANQARDAGEPKELADGAMEIAGAHGVDPDRVYVAGISAGAAMTVILGATYPDRFAAIGVVAGLEYGAASSLSGVYGASSDGGPDPLRQGKRAHTAMGAAARVVPTFVLHGDADGVVAPVNGEQVAAQWLRTNELVLGDGSIGEPTKTDGEAGYAFTRRVWTSATTGTKGGSIVEHVLVSGLGHAWPGGKAGGSFSDAKGPDASRTLWAFFDGRTLSAPIPDAPAEDPVAAPAPDAPGATTARSGAGGAPDDGGCATAGVPQRNTTFAAALAVGALAMLRRNRQRRR